MQVEKLTFLRRYRNVKGRKGGVTMGRGVRGIGERTAGSSTTEGYKKGKKKGVGSIVGVFSSAHSTQRGGKKANAAPVCENYRRGRKGGSFGKYRGRRIKALKEKHLIGEDERGLGGTQKVDDQKGGENRTHFCPNAKELR